MGDLHANFDRSEFACKCGCGFNTVDVQLLEILDVIRNHFDGKVKITSGCRCARHNKFVGGGINSQHLVGRAADIQVAGVTPKEVANYFDTIWPDKYGLGRYETFTHVDSRSFKVRW